MKRNIFYSMMGLAVVFCMMSCDGNPIKKMQATNDSLSNLTDKQQAELMDLSNTMDFISATMDSINALFINMFTAIGAGGAVVMAQYLGRQEDEKAVGIARPNMSNIVTGKTNPSLGTLESIADALGVEVAELFRPQDDFLAIIREKREKLKI